MLITVEGIVIGRRNTGEAGCYLDILTREHGVIEVMAHGVQKPTSKNAASTALFSYATFCLRKKGLRYTINSTAPKISFHRVSGDIEALSLAAYFADIVRYSSASEQEEILRFFAMALYELEQARVPYRLIKAVFELRIAAILGFAPDLRACAGCICYEAEEMLLVPEDGKLFCGECFYEYALLDKSCFSLSPTLLYTLRYVVYSPLEKIYRFGLGERSLKEFSVIAEEYLLYQLGRSFKTLDYFKRVELI